MKMIRSLEGTPEGEAPAAAEEQAATSAALQPVRGLLQDLGPAPSGETIDEARRELWARFPRGGLP